MSLLDLGKDNRDTLMRIVCDEYGLDDCFVKEEVDHKSAHVKYKLGTFLGIDLFLKEKPQYITNNHFELHLRLHEYAVKNQGPVARILRTTNGQLWFQWQGRKFELQEWVEGNTPVSPSLSDLAKFGELIALFQESVKGFKSKRHARWDFPKNRSFLSPERWFEISEYTSFLYSAFNQTGNKETDLIEHIRKSIEKRGRSIRWGKLPRQFVYGDFDCLNCVKDSSGKMVLLDLDLVHWGYRISDIAFAAAVTCGMDYSRSSGYHIRKKWRSDMARRLLSGYEKHSSFSNYEKQCLDELFALSLVHAFISCLDLDSNNPKIPVDLLEQTSTLYEILRHFG